MLAGAPKLAIRPVGTPAEKSPASHHDGARRSGARSRSPKARFSERVEAVRDDEDARGGQQGQDHAAQPVVAAVQPLVGEQPGAVVLDDAADGAEPRSMRLPYLADEGLDALARAEPAVVGAVVGRVGVEPADRGADGQGQA